MKSLSLKSKLFILVSMLLIFCTIVGVVGYISSQKIAKNYKQIEEVNLPNMTTLFEGLAHIRSARTYLVQLAIPNQPEKVTNELQEQVQKAIIDDYNEVDKKYREIPFGAGQEELYNQVKKAADTLKADFAKAMGYQMQTDGKEGPMMDKLRQLINKELYQDQLAYQAAFDKLIAWHRQDVKNNSGAAKGANKSGTIWSFTSILLAIFIGGLFGYLVMKNIVDEQDKAAETMIRAMRSHNMVEKSPINTMMASPDGTFIYMNENSAQTLRSVQQFLPDKVENLVGKNIDILHKNPDMIKKIIKDPKNLPHKALITLGPQTLSIMVAAIFDDFGKYLGPMVTWEVVTEKVKLVKDLTKASEDLTVAASNVLAVSTNLSAAAEETSAQANTASVASEEVNSGVQTVATNMAEMTSAIKEITKTTNEAASMTNEAMGLANNANQIINKLGESSLDIGNVIKVISSIAQQTNLLALNATIEAARAGEAGKGFAVVANEVKELAKQTATATNEITQKIEAIQTDSQNAVTAIAEISVAIEKVNGFNGNIAASVEEQSATTNEVTRIVSEAAEGVKQISENIQQVSAAAASTGRDAGDAQKAAQNMGEIAKYLNNYVTHLKV